MFSLSEQIKWTPAQGVRQQGLRGGHRYELAGLTLIQTGQLEADCEQWDVTRAKPLLICE